MGGDISHGSMVTKNYQGICDTIWREIKCEVGKEEKTDILYVTGVWVYMC